MAAAGEVAYLESDQASNVHFYERFGLETVGEQPVLGMPNWFMRRAPRPGTTHTFSFPTPVPEYVPEHVPVRVVLVEPRT